MASKPTYPVKNRTMNQLQKIKCALTSRMTIREYYTSLPTSTLESRRKTLWQSYTISGALWTLACLLTLIFAKMSTPVIILYSGVKISLCITLYTDYSNKKKLIDRIIQSRK
jgi:hypothetical protein